MKVFFSVGEPSGDLHGANLIRQLRQREPDLKCVGYGGPNMKDAGCDLHEDLTQFAVMWFLRAILNVHKFWELVGRADRYFRRNKPDAVVLIDYPGFNWWIARRAKVHGIPVFYYGTPQMWAWAPWRVHKMRRLVDHVLCKLPFEVSWYRQRGCHATYVGHPYFDELTSRELDLDFVNHQSSFPGQLVVILPGSRNQEVESNLCWFLKAAAIIRQRLPCVRFAIASYNQQQARLAEKMTSRFDVPVEIHVGKAPDLINVADCCLACSGSVSLELLYHTKPAVVHYRISRPAFFVQRFFRKVRYITLVNLLVSDYRYCDGAELYDPEFEDVPFPEYLTCVDRSSSMANDVIHWLTDDKSRQEVVKRLSRLKNEYAKPGASSSAAGYILGELSLRRSKEPRPHYRVNDAA